jgi:hypothetical protein
MKNILSLSIALLTLLSVSTAFTNAPVKVDKPTNKHILKFGAHWNTDPCYTRTTKNSIVITGFAAGLADGPLKAQVTGSYDCVNNGNQCPSADQWKALDLSDLIVTKKNSTGGNAKLTISFNSLCAHANWTFVVKDLQVRIYDANTGEDVIGFTDVEPCDPAANPCD